MSLAVHHITHEWKGGWVCISSTDNRYQNYDRVAHHTHWLHLGLVLLSLRGQVQNLMNYCIFYYSVLLLPHTCHSSLSSHPKISKCITSLKRKIIMFVVIQRFCRVQLKGKDLWDKKAKEWDGEREELPLSTWEEEGEVKDWEERRAWQLNDLFQQWIYRS